MVDIVLPGTADITKAFWWHLDDRWICLWWTAWAKGWQVFDTGAFLLDMGCFRCVSPNDRRHMGDSDVTATLNICKMQRMSVAYSELGTPTSRFQSQYVLASNYIKFRIHYSVFIPELGTKHFVKIHKRVVEHCSSASAQRNPLPDRQAWNDSQRPVRICQKK